jgi:hypothetical protein
MQVVFHIKLMSPVLHARDGLSELGALVLKFDFFGGKSNVVEDSSVGEGSLNSGVLPRTENGEDRMGEGKAVEEPSLRGRPGKEI